MKLWHKVFLYTFLLFEVVFTSSSFYMMQHNFKQNLEKEIERGLTEQRVIGSGMQSNWGYLNYKNQDLDINQEFSKNLLLNSSKEYTWDFLRRNSQQYTQYFDKKRVFIEILDEKNQTVYTSFSQKFDGSRKELEAPLSGKRSYIIRDIAKHSYLFVTSKLTLDDKTFKLSYIRDISDVYSDKSSQYSLFIKMNIMITIILALGLYVLIWYLTRSIRSLIKSTQTIVDGDYSQRVHDKSRDEIGILAQNFNLMAVAVEERIGELERVAKNKQDFIDCITHELKTPLTSIIGYADFLRSTKYNEEIFFNALNYIYSEGKRLESLSFKLMDLVLIEKENLVMKYEDILQLCSEVKKALEPRLKSSNIELILSVNSHKVFIEKDLFKVLCTNLIDNAIKASKAGSRIYVRGYMGGEEHFVFEVEDEGSGIPKEDVHKVFEPFFMVDKAKSRSFNGAGLGLAICAGIVRAHQGKIDITSSINKGTKVKIIFPGVYN